MHTFYSHLFQQAAVAAVAATAASAGRRLLGVEIILHAFVFRSQYRVPLFFDTFQALNAPECSSVAIGLNCGRK